MSPAMSKTLHSTDDTPSVDPAPEAVASAEAPAADVPATPKEPQPNAIVTRAQCDAARETGTWKHDNASTALWLNSTVAAKGLSAEALAETLAVYGVDVR